MSSGQRDLGLAALGVLVAFRELGVLPFDVGDPVAQRFPGLGVLDRLDELGEALREEEPVPPVVLRPGLKRFFRFGHPDGGDPEDFVQDVEVVRDVERVARVFVGEEVRKVVKAAPDDRA